MLAIRPTFSESWYRVANLKAKLRASAQISRQFYRGERWYVVRDPAGSQFHRLSDAAYRFVGLLDGTRTVAEAWDLVGGQLEDDAPTQPEVIQILTQLHAANLLEADITPDASVLLRRHRFMMKRRMQGRLMNMLFPRIPLWNPDRFLVRWMPLCQRIFSFVGGIVWLIVILSAIAVLAPRWADLKSGADRAIAPGNWLWLWASFVFIKLIHELGHAFSCRRFGGEVHELGVMFLIFIPTPYVDASTAWAFPSRWQRMFVGAAGMIVELFVAALAAFVWAYTNYAAYPTISGLAYNVMLIASVSTILFNANPLLRYDGYYMLSDFLEIPNLRQKSTEYALGLIKRHVFRIKQTQPLPPVVQRVWLLTYAVTSSIYRVWIGIMIILLVTYRVPVLGVLMALGGVATWMIVPVFKTVKYLSLEPELHRKRTRATIFTVGVAAAVAILIGQVRFPVHFDAIGVVEPQQRQLLHAKANGFVSQIVAKDGDSLRKDQVILVCRDPKLEAELAQRQSELREMEARWHQAVGQEDEPQRRVAEYRITAAKEELQRLLDKQADLTVRAPFAGQLVAPHLRDLAGLYLPQGQEIAQVATIERLMVRATLEQGDAELGAQFVQRARELGPDQVDEKTEVRLAGDPRDRLHGIGAPWLMSPQDTLPHPSIGPKGGGDIPTDPRDPQGTKPLIDQFEVRVNLLNPALPGTPGSYLYSPGQRAHVRFTFESRSVIWRCWRWFWQMVQVKNTQSEWI